MAEIKSTLDLVLEKTKDLRFSPEERRALEIEQALKAFNGLLQRFLDGQLDADRMPQEIASVMRDYNLSEPRALQEALLAKIDLDALAGPLPDLLQRLFPCNPDALRALGATYRQEVAIRARERRRELAAYLQSHHEISGTAVVPNLALDAKWKDESTILRELFSKKLAEEKAKLAPAHP